MKPQVPIRIGVIGAGANTRAKHIPGFQSIPGVEVAVVCNRSLESSRRVAREFGIPHVAEQWREVIESPDVDAICIGTWPNLHARLAIDALRAGKHVLTEARMARDLAEAQLMLDEAKQQPHLVAQIVPAPMSLPFDATVQDLLAQKSLGEIREAAITCTNAALADPTTPASWRQDVHLSGRNTMFLGIYYEMLRRWIGADPVDVVADAAVFTRQRRNSEGEAKEIQIPESVSILGRYQAGARLIAHFSNVETTAPRAEIRLNGSEGGVRLDLATETLWLARRGEPEKRVEIPAEKRGGWRVEHDFIESIREGKPVRLTDFATGVRYMAFTDAVWESWNSGAMRTLML